MRTIGKSIGLALLSMAVAAPAYGFLGEDRGYKITLEADYVFDGKFSVSNGSGGFPDDTDFDTNFYIAKLGVRPEAFGGRASFISFEVHYGISKSDDEDPEFVKTDKYYGGFIVPTATVLELFELSFPLGYARTEMAAGSAEESYNSIAFGANVQFPVKLFFESLPDIRFVVGGMVFHQSSDARIYGYTAGLRWDF
jgi:hypothetical protein